MCYADECRMPMAITNREEQQLIDQVFTRSFFDDKSGIRLELSPSQYERLDEFLTPKFDKFGTFYFALLPKKDVDQLMLALRNIGNAR